ncbi:MAG: double zinc ribbon domain-containing protein [Candidatus Izemoplasmatales bacterium]
MKRCVYCGRESANDKKFCKYCGESLDNQSYQSSEEPEVEVLDDDRSNHHHKNNGPVRCPNCGSAEIYLMTRESGGFDASNACCGYIILGPLGLLCGLSSERESVTVRKCKNCGYEF